MSDKVLIPKPDVLVETCNAGFIRYRMAYTSIRVDEMSDGGRRLEVCEDGRIIIFDLSAEQAKYLADRLVISLSHPERAAS